MTFMLLKNLAFLFHVFTNIPIFLIKQKFGLSPPSPLYPFHRRTKSIPSPRAIFWGITIFWGILPPSGKKSAPMCGQACPCLSLHLGVFAPVWLAHNWLKYGTKKKSPYFSFLHFLVDQGDYRLNNNNNNKRSRLRRCIKLTFHSVFVYIIFSCTECAATNFYSFLN